MIYNNQAHVSYCFMSNLQPTPPLCGVVCFPKRPLFRVLGEGIRGWYNKKAEQGIIQTNLELTCSVA